MITTSFYNLKSMIAKACNGQSDAKDYAGKHKFCIDMHTLDNMFSQKGLDYHVMAGTTNLESYIPFTSDIPTLSDYVESHSALIDIMDGYTQIAIFTLFTTHDKNGEIVINNDEDKQYTGKELFTVCNNPKKLDVDLMCTIMMQVPNYKILVARKFNPETDSFGYEIHFRSSKKMSSYYRSTLDKAQNQEKGEEEKSED